MRLAHILITGASSGIGAATARALVAQGDTVFLMARSAAGLQDIADQCGPKAHAMPCDASDADAVSACLAQIISDHGPLDAVVNCAGAGAWKPVQDTPPAEARQMMDAPYFAAYNTTYAVLPDMLARNAGTLIHVNSPACFAAWPNSVGYAAARGALRAFHEALAQDLQGTGVRSCHVVFGEVASAYFETNAVSRDAVPKLGRILPLLSPEDCAKVIVDTVRRPRAQVIRPRLLAAMERQVAILPGLSRWMLRF